MTEIASQAGRVIRDSASLALLPEVTRGVRGDAGRSQASPGLRETSAARIEFKRAGRRLLAGKPWAIAPGKCAGDRADPERFRRVAGRGGWMAEGWPGRTKAGVRPRVECAQPPCWGRHQDRRQAAPVRGNDRSGNREPRRPADRRVPAPLHGPGPARWNYARTREAHVRLGHSG
jgi:hypothetical protein